jgi:hypothetical protein
MGICFPRARHRGGGDPGGRRRPCPAGLIPAQAHCCPGFHSKRATARILLPTRSVGRGTRGAKRRGGGEMGCLRRAWCSTRILSGFLSATAGNDPSHLPLHHRPASASVGSIVPPARSWIAGGNPTRHSLPIFDREERFGCDGKIMSRQQNRRHFRPIYGALAELRQTNSGQQCAFAGMTPQGRWSAEAVTGNYPHRSEA